MARKGNPNPKPPSSSGYSPSFFGFDIINTSVEKGVSSADVLVYEYKIA
jgi:hypothetical protein